MAKRDQIAAKYKWNAEDIVKESEWDNLYEDVKKRAAALGAFNGKVGTADGFYAFSKSDENVTDDLMRLYCFAHMKHDEDASLSKYTAMLDRADMLATLYGQTVAFVLPELTALEEKQLSDLANSPKLKDYDYFFRKIIKTKQHILSAKEEELLAGMSEISGGFSDVFNMIDNVDLNLGTITVDGKEEQLSHGKYSAFLQSDDRGVRKAAFEKYYEAYKKLIHTIATTYSNNVKKDWFYAKARKYSSCLEAALSAEDADPQVYRNLIEAVDENLGVMHEYIDYKKQMLKVDEFHMYDMYVPVIEGARLELEYEDAYALVKKGLAVLGTEYQGLLDKAFSEGWIDVFENDGKRSGAYSTSVRTCHPFVLLNYVKTAHDVFTIAHELGHAMHSYYSAKTQPAAKSDYVIFVAEVASTVNEVLLLKHIVKNTEDKQLKKYLLQYFLEMLRTTLFRQSQFAEFEYKAHTMVENGQPLTVEGLSDMYYELNKRYYGDSLAADDCICYEWSRIPHFYRGFYVYKYSTGIITAVSIADGILSGDESKLKAYMNFLKSGGSNSPVELLKIAGVDLTTKQPFERAMKVFKETLTELKNS